MSAFPTTAAGTVAIGFAVLHVLVFVLHSYRPTSRLFAVLAALSGIAVLPSAIDSIVVHGERAVLVFGAMAVGLAGAILAIAVAWGRGGAPVVAQCVHHQQQAAAVRGETDGQQSYLAQKQLQQRERRGVRGGSGNPDDGNGAGQ